MGTSPIGTSEMLVLLILSLYGSLIGERLKVKATENSDMPFYLLQSQN
jgi:hypothetical protein